jgi:hypothetical protein
MRINYLRLYSLMTTGLLALGPASRPLVAQESSKAPMCTPDNNQADPTHCIKGNSTSCPLLSRSTSEPTGPPLSLSQSGLYFQPYLNGAYPLLGESYEYLCHVCQPNLDNYTLNTPPPTAPPTATCTLNNFSTLLGTMNDNHNNVIRLEAIFSFSPGRYMTPCCQPYADEQPFVSTGTTQWNLNKINMTYLSNLDAVVHKAYDDKIVVEVTLFDPWDGYFQGGPFYSANETYGRGFGQWQYFASFTAPVQGEPWTPTCGGGDPWIDVPGYCGEGPWMDTLRVASTDTGNNCFARHAQALALKSVVQQLNQYPNVIWEVANEPENWGKAPVAPGGATQLPDIVQWEQWVISQIIQWDPKRDSTGACTLPAAPAHPIQINGHYWEASESTMAWAFAPTVPSNLSASLHYAFNQHPPDYAKPGYYGAIDFWRPLPNSTDSKLSNSPLLPVGFNEGIPLPDALYLTGRTDEGVRAEALEFITSGGARFDGYSLDYQSSTASALSVELGYLADLLAPNDPEGFGLTNLDKMSNTDCSKPGSWCWLTDAGGNTASTCLPPVEGSIGSERLTR